MDGKWLRSGFVLLALSAALCGCKPDANQVRLKDTATALAKAADACLLDVRDKKLKYDKSPQCDSLRSLYLQHLDAGGFRPDTSTWTHTLIWLSRTCATKHASLTR